MFQQVPVGTHLPPPHTGVALHNWFPDACYHYQILHMWAGSCRVSLLLFCDEHCLISVKNTAKSSRAQGTTNLSRQQEDVEQSL